MLEALVVCVVSLNAAALRPAARLVALPSRPRSAVSARLAVSLPGFGGGSASGGDSGPSEESVQYYRLLGVGEDATYDDVNSKYDELAARYVDDPKMTIKLQVAKDKIFDDKLRQRLSGRTVSGVKDPFENLGNEKKPLITLPPFLDSVMELPSRSALLENAAVFGAIGLLPMLSKGWASSSVGIGFAVGLYKLYNRGVPQSSGMGAEMRPPKVEMRPPAPPPASTVHASP